MSAAVSVGAKEDAIINCGRWKKLNVANSHGSRLLDGRIDTSLRQSSRQSSVPKMSNSSRRRDAYTSLDKLLCRALQSVHYHSRGDRFRQYDWLRRGFWVDEHQRHSRAAIAI